MRSTTYFLLVLVTFSSEIAAEPLGLPAVPIPNDNRQSQVKIALGQRLFEDRRFSADGTISCASCHEANLAFADGRQRAVGIDRQVGTRNTPTTLNAAYFTSLFWDGRAESLEEQALGPFVNPIEHGLRDHRPIVEIVRTDTTYPDQFLDAFGVGRTSITIGHVTQAIASYERTLIAGDSPFDRFEFGGDPAALGEAAQRGLAVFRGKGNCTSCHRIGRSSALFTDNSFHNLGVGFNLIEDQLDEVLGDATAELTAVMSTDLPNLAASVDEMVLSDQEISELGRFNVTMRERDIGRFKTPSLRNVELTAPYMHNGGIDTLEDVVNFYNRGGNENEFQDRNIEPLNLSDREKTDLVRFLRTLTSSELPN